MQFGAHDSMAPIRNNKCMHRNAIISDFVFNYDDDDDSDDGEADTKNKRPK